MIAKGITYDNPDAIGEQRAEDAHTSARTTRYNRLNRFESHSQRVVAEYSSI